MSAPALPPPVQGAVRERVRGPVPVWPVRTPGPPGRRTLAALAAVGLLASVLPGRPAGLGMTLLGWSMLAAGAVLVHRRRLARRDAGPADVRTRRGLAALAAALCTVPSVSTSAWLVLVCLLGAFAVAGIAAVDARTWRAVLLSPLLLPVGAGLAPGWLLAGVRLLPARRAPGARRPGAGGPPRARQWLPWLRAAVVTVPVVVLVGALLSAADPVFAAALDRLAPRLQVPDLDLLPLRIVVAALAAGTLAAVLRAALVTSRTADPARPARRRPAPEWAVPLAALDVLLAAFLALQAYTLFGGPEVVRETGLTYAERARQGFGQLAAVTVVTLAVVAWAALRCDAGRRRDRTVRDVLAGLLLLQTLLLAGSALHRMSLYEQAYGSTVARYVAAVAEVTLCVVVALVAAARWRPVARLLPRLVVAAAGCALLVLGLTRPDAVVAARSVERYAQTGDLDVSYLSGLSDDALPALARLPRPQEPCVLPPRDVPDRSLLAANLSAHRAREAAPSVLFPCADPAPAAP